MIIDAEKWDRPSLDEIDRMIRSTGLSKSVLGKRIGYSQRAVEKWANGQNQMSFCVWVTIVRIVQQNARDLLVVDG